MKTTLNHKGSDILFINPPNFPFTSSGILIEPIDTLGLASWTKHLGYSCSILDMDVKELLAKDLDKILQIKPKIIIIVFDYHIPLHDVGANSEIKNICDWARTNNIHSVLGGKAATFMEKEKLKNIFGADFYISYEMEYTLKEIFDRLLTTNELANKNTHALNNVKNISFEYKNKFIIQPHREEKVQLNDLPIPDRNLLDLNDYIDVRTMLSSRGCNLQCTFCHVPGFWGWWRARTPELVVDEMETLHYEHHAKKILFLDDNAFVQPKRMMNISDIIQERNLQVKWGCLGTIDRYNPEALEKMAKSGFAWIHYGAESGDDEQLSTMGKRITNSKISHAVKGTQKLGIRVRTSWILDMPNLTIEGLKKTEDLILSQGSEEIRLHFLTLRLGSILHNERQEIQTPQFIHNNKQNINLSSVSSDDIEKSVEYIVNNLVSQGYKVVKNAKDFKNVEKLKENNPELRIVSLCPLRYGLNWIKDNNV